MKYTVEYPVKPNGISQSLIFIEETLEKYRLGQRDLMEALLISEETLMMLEENASEEAVIKITILKHMGVPRIKIIVPGTALTLDEHMGSFSFEQLGGEADSAIRSIMLRSYSDSIKYKHTRSLNILTITTGIPERILSTYTITAILLAVITGFAFKIVLPDEVIQWMLMNICDPVETLFISALMCITAPAVFISITCSMFKFEGLSELGENGKRVVGCYALLSVIATFVGILSFQIFKPGEAGLLADYNIAETADEFSIMANITTIIPHNIIEPFISVNSLQLMIIALVIGSAMTMSGKRVLNLKIMFEELDVLCSNVSAMLMKIVPIAVYCSIMNVIFSTETRTFIATLELIGSLLAGFLIMMGAYLVLLYVATGLSPITFMSKYSQTMKNTFLKGSGVAAIPMTMRVCRRRLGVPQHISSFSIPLGATINMVGNCICLVISCLYFTHVCGVALDMEGLLILFFLVLVLSLGAPIAPGTLILCLITLLAQLGIDTSIISLIIGINFILEMLIGMVNTVGDVIVALIVSRRDGTLNLDTYNQK